MSLPKGQHFEYRIVWETPLGFTRQFVCSSGLDHAEHYSRHLTEQGNRNVRIERRPVGEWEAP